MVDLDTATPSFLVIVDRGQLRATGIHKDLTGSRILKSQAYDQISRRARQLRHTWRSEGPVWISHRIRSVLADQIKPKLTIPEVDPSDVLSADLTKLPSRDPLPISGDEAIRVNWVMSPPARGSGGHTTLFRFIKHLQANGYDNAIYFYDPYRGDHRYYQEIVRSYYGFNGYVGPAGEAFRDAHAVVATSWPTAYPVYNSPSKGKRIYFVQDFEPAFHACSSDSTLAENTYRMGFHAITAGRWLAEKLRSDFDMQADHFDFGCDTTSYKRHEAGVRSGIAFYARPQASRRGFEIGVMALELFAKRRPDIEIHMYGDTIGKRPFAFTNHGLVTPQALNAIYNRCFAGLSLSLTNVSLVPFEMLASGCIPVMNDAHHNRIVLDNSFIRYAPPTPHDLALELESVVATRNFCGLSHAASESVKLTSWQDAGVKVDEVIRRIVTDPCTGRQASFL